MSLYIKQLNADASFLLSFEPTPKPTSSNETPSPFTILTDPWIVGPSKVIHPLLAVTTHRFPACISTLRNLPEPDLVVISQHKSDHCNEATLRQLPPRGTKTLILAVPPAAKLIKSWNYFDEAKIVTIPRWEETSRVNGHKEPIVRVPVPSLVPGGPPGEVTVAYVPQKRDVGGLHGAIGITYTEPPNHQGAFPRYPVTPPATPDGDRTIRLQPRPVDPPAAQALHLAPPTPPASPSRSLRSA
ncbi:MBL fold metallo-hydrolase, partial [Candidatus Bathyarchaeota archaeon]|nr:MBL fold metallo-hydrolase [Candidatus Bathyarchaeota archaeon]